MSGPLRNVFYLALWHNTGEFCPTLPWEKRFFTAKEPSCRVLQCIPQNCEMPYHRHFRFSFVC